jgi:hypothetical protein
MAGATPRTRFHGLQAVVLGVAWPLALLGAALVTPGVTQAIAALGALTWLVLLVGTALGKSPRLPGLGMVLWTLASDSPRGVRDEP